jgi:sarcosine oxidase subunit gamma
MDRRSPLAGWPGIAAPRLRVAELPFRTQTNVRAADPAGVDLGVPLPVVPGTSNRSGDTLVLWLGPDEWLVTDAPDAKQLSTVDGAALVDVSAQRTTVLIEGECARDVLAHGCPLDLHPTAFPVGACAQSLLAHVPVVLVRVAEDAYWVLVRASFARHVADWIDDASIEYRIP